MGLGDSFGFWNYDSDDGNTYAVKLSALTAAAGGFTEADLEGANFYPYGPKNMRHVWGVADTGKRARIPLATNSNAKFVSLGTFSLHGVDYKIEGAIGEARKLSFLGG